MKASTAFRCWTYDRIGNSDPARRSELDLHTDRMRAVRATLVWLKENEALIKQRVSY